MEFTKFKIAVAKQFEAMAKHTLFRTSVEKDDLWDTYLKSFPPGTNPLYKTRTEYDCNCCKNFIRAVGNVVAVIEGKMVSVWDTKIDEPNFQVVADALAKKVKSFPIVDNFLHFEATAGTNLTRFDSPEGVQTWNHFFVNLPPAYVMKGTDIGTSLGTSRANHDVLARSLAELDLDAVDTVLDLIAQNSLYRGQEHKATLEAFRKLKVDYDKLPSAQQNLFAWVKSVSAPGAVTRVRNTSIGTLLIDLSAGVDLEIAVKKFEAVVAPANYKRPTALVTKAMIDKAKATITELGLNSALERRYANIEDITINNVLFANRSARKSMDADVFDELSAKVSTKPKSMDKIEEVPIAKFLSDILPKATSLELLIENRHAANLVSLIAAADPTAKQLFKWPNLFSWSYNGEMADSIKEKVKAAGGSVEGVLCCRLAWDYTDDLDFHMFEPAGGHISYMIRRQFSHCGGQLDVDANGADGPRADPVENIFYPSTNRMAEGVYRLVVHNYNRRSSGTGFEVEIEFGGQTFHIAHDRVLREHDQIEVAQIEYTKKDGFKLLKSLPSSQVSKELWGLTTQTYVPVNVLMFSPNYWDDHQVGNQHYFFMLEGCRNEGQARGFFNEFLSNDLNVHRKTLEMVGSKMRPGSAERQLSGLGFSSTQRSSVLCRVQGSFSRSINLVF